MNSSADLSELAGGLARVAPDAGEPARPGVYGPRTPGTQTAGLQEAIDQVARAGGGAVHVLPGVYRVSAGVRFSKFVSVIGYGATLVNAGNLKAPFGSSPDDVLIAGRLVGLTLDGGGVGGQTVLSLVSPQHCHVDLRVVNCGAGSTGVRISSSSTATPVGQSERISSVRSVYSLDIDDCATGLLIQGIEHQPVTNNAFLAVFATRCSVAGVNVQEHADNNVFLRVHATLNADGAVGFSVGRLGQGTQANHNCVVKLTVDAYKPSNCYALVMNACNGTHVMNLQTSGEGFAKMVQAAPGAMNFTVFNAREMVRYEAASPSQYPRP